MDYAAAILKRLPQGWRSTGIGELLETARSYLPEDDIPGIARAYEFGAEAHGEQRRLTGEPYISHPVAVASILAELRLDADTLRAALSARCSRRYPNERGRFDGSVRCGREPSRRRSEQARTYSLRQPCRGAGRKFSQDASGDG